MRKQTKKIELVETHNMATSLRRIYLCPGPTTRKTRRAFYNAAQLSEVFSDSELSTLRVALNLP